MSSHGAAPSSTFALVRSLWPRRSKLLDIGCGSGATVRALIAMGHRASGCDPQAERVAEARAGVPGAEFATAGAEALPYASQSFDGALMVQSLHHVPGALMRSALAEAIRCIGPDGYLAVIEPLATGSFFEILRIIDDETAVRAAAQAALDEACKDRRLRRVASHQWTRRDTYRSVDEVIAKLIANDPARAAAAAAARPALEAAFERVGEKAEGGRALVHLTRADVFVGGE